MIVTNLWITNQHQYPNYQCVHQSQSIHQEELYQHNQQSLLLCNEKIVLNEGTQEIIGAIGSIVNTIA